MSGARVLKISAIICSVVISAIIGITAFIGDQVVKSSTQLSYAVDEIEVPYNVYDSYHLDYGEFTRRYPIKKIELDSTYDGHVIPADYIYHEKNGSMDNDTVIMIHGLGGNRMTIYPAAQVFLENGYNVLCYDQRSSGENHALHTTFGYLEKYDLLDAVKAVKEYAPGKKMGIWGTSFGGATAVAGACDPELGITAVTDFLILDCPISNMEDELRLVMNNDETIAQSGIPVSYMIRAGNIMNKLELGFTYKEADGRYIIQSRKNQAGDNNKDVPLLIFNCKKDEITPFIMGVELFNAYNSENKQIITFDDCGHAEGWAYHEEEYRTAVKSFLERADR